MINCHLKQIDTKNYSFLICEIVSNVYFLGISNKWVCSNAISVTNQLLNLIAFQGWEDLQKLCKDFPDDFGSIISDLNENLEEWKKVNDITFYI